MWFNIFDTTSRLTPAFVLLDAADGAEGAIPIRREPNTFIGIVIHEGSNSLMKRVLRISPSIASNTVLSGLQSAGRACSNRRRALRRRVEPI